MKHKVTFSMPTQRELGPTDVIFRVHDEQSDELFGTLGVSKGGIVWHPGKGKKKRWINWQKLDRIAQEHGWAREEGPR